MKVGKIKIDILLENHGSLYLFRPVSRKGEKFLNETAPEDAQFLGNAMACEPRYVSGVLQVLEDEGIVWKE